MTRLPIFLFHTAASYSASASLAALRGSFFPNSSLVRAPLPDEESAAAMEEDVKEVDMPWVMIHNCECPCGTSIRTGTNVWAVVRVTLVEDANVGDNCVIAAVAIVGGVFPANSVWGGVAPKVIKTLGPSPANCWCLFQQ